MIVLLFWFLSLGSPLELWGFAGLFIYLRSEPVVFGP